MKYKCAEDFRDIEVRLLYDAILKKNLKENIPLKQAKEAALDAVALRFTLSHKRARIIVSAQANANARGKLASLIIQNEALMRDLRVQIAHMKQSIIKSEKLLEVLNIANENYKNYR